MSQSVRPLLQNAQVPFQQQFLRAQFHRLCKVLWHVVTSIHLIVFPSRQVILNLPLHAISLTHHWNLKYIGDVCRGEGEGKERWVTKP